MAKCKASTGSAVNGLKAATEQTVSVVRFISSDLAVAARGVNFRATVCIAERTHTVASFWRSTVSTTIS